MEKKNIQRPSSVNDTLERAASTSETDAISALITGERRRTRARRWIFVLVVGVVLLAAGVGVLRYRRVEAEERGPGYVFETVERGSLVAAISATGTVEALNTVEVGAEISGRILVLNADFNDQVKAGDVLAEIDPEQHKAAVAQARAQMLAAKAQVAEAEATLVETRQAFQRSKALSQKGLLSIKELETAEAKEVRASAVLSSAKASAALAKASLDSARSKLSKTQIICPINGTVLSREVEVGQTLNAGMQTPVLYVIAEDLKRMRLSSRVDEADIGQVTEGLSATFTVDAYPGKQFNSTVTAVRNVPETEENVVSYEVILSVDNREKLLKPGMTASVEIVTRRLDGVLLVSNKAFRFSPELGRSGMRGPPMPFFRRKGKRGKGGAVGPGAGPTKLSKLSGNEGRLWIAAEGGPPGGLSPVVVDKLATDGVKTAIASKRLDAGDAIVVEADELSKETP